jgi:hypothetical protein
MIDGTSSDDSRLERQMNASHSSRNIALVFGLFVLWWIGLLIKEYGVVVTTVVKPSLPIGVSSFAAEVFHAALAFIVGIACVLCVRSDRPVRWAALWGALMWGTLAFIKWGAWLEDQKYFWSHAISELALPNVIFVFAILGGLVANVTLVLLAKRGALTGRSRADAR